MSTETEMSTGTASTYLIHRFGTGLTGDIKRDLITLECKLYVI